MFWQMGRSPSNLNEEGSKKEMEIVMLFFSFIADWLLFSFPLYQGCLELKEQIRVIDVIRDTDKYEKVSAWYWFISIKKLYLEKKRALTILKNENIEYNQLKKILMFFDKASAWFWVSLAGLLKFIESTANLVSFFFLKHRVLIVILVSLFMVLAGLFMVSYRLSNKRTTRLVNKYYTSDDSEDTNQSR